MERRCRLRENLSLLRRRWRKLLEVLLAPFPHLKLIPTGGVTLQTAESFIKAGARALGVGSDLVNLAAVEAGHPESITETARAYLKVLTDARKN